MPDSTRIRRLVEFADTDAAGIAHFTAFLAWMEQAEHEFLRRHGLSVLMHDDEGPISWPRVHVHCDFSGAVKFEDLIEIEVRIVRKGEKSLTYGFRFFHETRPVATGEIASVCCRLEGGKPPRAIPIPAWFAEKLPSE